MRLGFNRIACRAMSENMQFSAGLCMNCITASGQVKQNHPVCRVEQTLSTRRKTMNRAGYTFANRCTLSLHGKRQRPSSATALPGRCVVRAHYVDA